MKTSDLEQWWPDCLQVMHRYHYYECKTGGVQTQKRYQPYLVRAAEGALVGVVEGGLAAPALVSSACPCNPVLTIPIRGLRARLG